MYTEEEVERSYEEFYEDVHTEFLKFGEIINFKVCRNGSFHLRGNVYIEYKSLDSAVMAYNSVHGRYFAGKQVKCEFVSLTRWKVAICGEYMKSRLKTCSRGSACNFLHCFTNPGGDYEWADSDKPPPRFWVKKMLALFGHQQSPSDHHHHHHHISTSDKDRYHEKRHRSIETNQHNGSWSRSHREENHRQKDDKSYEHETKYKNNEDYTDLDEDRLDKSTSRRHRDGSQTHTRHNKSESTPRDYYRKSKRKTHGSSSDEEDFYNKKRSYNTKSSSRHKTDVSDSSNDEESDDVKREASETKLQRREKRKTGHRRSRRRDGDGEVERRRHGGSRSRGGGGGGGGGGGVSEKNEMSDRWEPDGSLDELKNREGDGESNHGENRKSRDRDDNTMKRKRI
ncbi:hypothetical protein L1887_31447 [Cichorium endivia]|nr:hypothetical protein L1887_31447 [Cichorium endivia]